MKYKIKTAVIGAGNMGKNHVRVLSQISHLVGIADIDRYRGQLLSKEFNTRYYQDFRKLIDRENPEIVFIVVPTDIHKKVALYCLGKKKAILLEKPIAASIIQAKSILKKVQETKGCLMIGHIERFNPAVIKLKNLIEKGQLGEIISLLAIRVGVNPPPTKNSDVALELGIHDVDVFDYLLNERPLKKKVLKTKIYHYNKADSASIILKYKKVSALIQTNWITPSKIRKLYVTGTEGFAELDYISQKLILSQRTNGQQNKEIFTSKKEPLKEEIKFLLKNYRNKNFIYPNSVLTTLQTVIG